MEKVVLRKRNEVEFLKSTKIIVISIKGGQGKTMVATNIAYALSEFGNVAICDLDIDSPHVPAFFREEIAKVSLDKTGLKFNPVIIKGVKHEIRANSMSFLIDMEGKSFMQNGVQHRVIIKDMIFKTNWGANSFMILDTPAGSGDEIDVALKCLNPIDGAVIVGQPNLPESIMRCIDLCSFKRVHIVGCVVNMYGARMHGETVKCKHCNKDFMPLPDLGAIEACTDNGIKMLGTIPMDPSYVDSPIDLNLEAVRNARDAIRAIRRDALGNTDKA